MKQIAAESLRKLLSYDAGTGVFVWIVDQGARAKKLSVAGSTNQSGYRVIQINKRPYMAHRLAFLYMTGELPSKIVDHINGIKTDNRFVNLRQASYSLNLQNLRGPRADSRSGVMGAHRLPGQRERWQARITVSGKRISLGVFGTPELAGEAYLSAKRIHHEGNTL